MPESAEPLVLGSPDIEGAITRSSSSRSKRKPPTSTKHLSVKKARTLNKGLSTSKQHIAFSLLSDASQQQGPFELSLIHI